MSGAVADASTDAPATREGTYAVLLRRRRRQAQDGDRRDGRSLRPDLHHARSFISAGLRPPAAPPNLAGRTRSGKARLRMSFGRGLSFAVPVALCALVAVGAFATARASQSGWRDFAPLLSRNSEFA